MDLQRNQAVSLRPTNEPMQLQLQSQGILTPAYKQERNFTKKGWDSQRAEITRLYKNSTLASVVIFMRREYGLVATEKQYKDRIKKWGLNKGIQASGVEAIIRKQQKRVLESNKPSAFRVRKQLVTQEKINRYIKEHYVLPLPTNQDENVDENMGSAATPPDISCYTPPNMGPLSPQPDTRPQATLSPPTSSNPLATVHPSTLFSYKGLNGDSVQFSDPIPTIPNSSLLVIMTGNVHGDSPLHFDEQWSGRYDEETDMLYRQALFGNDVEEIIRTKPLTNSASSGPSERSRSQYPDLSMIAPSPAISPLLEFHAPVFMELTDRRNQHRLVDHFCNVLSHLIVFKEDTGNPFRQLVLALSHGCSAVMNAIFALSSAHLEYRGIENEEKSMDFRNRALWGLAQLIQQNEPANREEILGAIMLLVYYEVLVLRGSSNIVNSHLKGAMTIMRPDPQISTPTSVSLEKAFRFYNVIAALSLGTSPNTNTQPTSSPFPWHPKSNSTLPESPLNAVDTLLGLLNDLWPIIHRLSHLPSYKNSLKTAVAAGQTSTATVLRVELENASQAIELALTNWKPTLSSMLPISIDESSTVQDTRQDSEENTRIQSILNNAEAYRHSAFIYLYRNIHSLPSSHSLVQKHVHLSLLACSNVVKLPEQCQDGPMTALLWPLFVAACEATTKEDRALAMDTFIGMERRQGMNNIMRAWEVTQEVWRRGDLQDDEVDWREIYDERVLVRKGNEHANHRYLVVV